MREAAYSHEGEDEEGGHVRKLGAIFLPLLSMNERAMALGIEIKPVTKAETKMKRF